jgi:hypothetical protein
MITIPRRKFTEHIQSKLYLVGRDELFSDRDVHVHIDETWSSDIDRVVSIKVLGLEVIHQQIVEPAAYLKSTEAMHVDPDAPRKNAAGPSHERTCELPIR